jgi:hypothetical protein
LGMLIGDNLGGFLRDIELLIEVYMSYSFDDKKEMTKKGKSIIITIFFKKKRSENHQFISFQFK